MTGKTLFILGYIGSLCIFPLYLFIFKKDITYNLNSIHHHIGVISGAVASIGSLFFYLALSKGEASRVMSLTALYPLVTVILSVIFFKEPIGIKKLIGVISALIAMYLLSS